MKLHIHRLLTTFLLFAWLSPGKEATAQADITKATHWYNRAYYNPAFIARPEYLYLFSSYRQQWIGVAGAPTIFNIQASEYIHKLRSAIGISFVGDRIGATRAYNPMVSYAYRIAVDENRSLSMGLSVGMFTRMVDGSSFEADNVTDPSLYYNKEKFNQPDANVGLEYHSAHFILGVASTHLQSFIKSENSFLNTNHRYGYVIYKNAGNEFFNYNAGLQVINRQNLTIYEGNICMRFKRQTGLLEGAREMFDAGLTYRTSREMILLLGLNISANVKVGYAFDQNFGIGYNRNSTHEIMCEYRIPNKAASARYKCKESAFWYH